MSEYLKLSWSDLANGLAVAIFTAILQFLYQFVGEHGLNFSATDWTQLLGVALLAALGYLSKNFLKDSDGKLVGKIQL
jgi:putative Mn2+ efflux pump MntP